MNWPQDINCRPLAMLFLKPAARLIAATFLSSAFLLTAQAADSPWTTTSTVQGYWQTYSGTTTRDNAFNVGAYLLGDYLESSTIGAGYNFTYTSLDNSAEIMEHLFYFTGRHHWFADALSGKLTLRLDLYGGESILEYRSNNPPTGMGRKFTPGSSGTSRETTSISAFQPIVSYINFSKTFYLDLGYAHSRYDENPDATVNQLTPTVGFGWNESYDWLQVRAYVISLDENDGNFDDDQYESLELSYTHWFADGAIPQLDFLRITMLAGERVLTVDPDAAVIYSAADKQTSGLSASMQWKLDQSIRLRALISASQYENDVVADKYDSLLFYLNIQHQW